MNLQRKRDIHFLTKMEKTTFSKNFQKIQFFVLGDQEGIPKGELKDLKKEV
jgi:hypothetical protein